MLRVSLSILLLFAILFVLRLLGFFFRGQRGRASEGKR